MSIRLLSLLVVTATGCAHTLAPTHARSTETLERVETRVGTFLVRTPGPDATTASPADQLKVVLAGGEAPTVFYAGLD